jgi:hypothetical protein
MRECVVAPDNGCDGFLNEVIYVIVLTAAAREEGPDSGLPD